MKNIIIKTNNRFCEDETDCCSYISYIDDTCDIFRQHLLHQMFYIRCEKCIKAFGD